MKYTESQIKNIGGKRYLKRRKKRILLLLALCIAWMPLLDWMTTSIRMWVYFAPLALVLVNIIWGYYTARKNFYEQVKKNPELLE